MVPTAVVVRLISTKSTYPALAHDPPDHLGYTFEECHGRQDLLPPFQRNWHKNHDWLWCSPYHHLVPTNTPCISRRHFRSCTFHNTCRSLGPWLFCTQKHLPALSIFAFSNVHVLHKVALFWVGQLLLACCLKLVNLLLVLLHHHLAQTIVVLDVCVAYPFSGGTCRSSGGSSLFGCRRLLLLLLPQFHSLLCFFDAYIWMQLHRF